MTAQTLDQAPAIPAALASFDSLPDAGYVRLPVVAALKGIAPATVWRWVREGRLPAPVKLGPNTTAWKVGDLRRAEVA
jgi:predicted DNA-binding transcriptional regulator AlpA